MLRLGRLWSKLEIKPYAFCIFNLDCWIESKSLIQLLTLEKLEKYIEIDSSKRFGKPILKGTRISIYDVLNWMANGMSKSMILEDFPELTEAQINACLAYAANREKKLNIAS